MRKLFLLLVLNLNLATMAINSVSQEFNRNELSVEVMEVDGKQVSLINYSDADMLGAIGEPNVPVKTLRISVPYNAVNIKLSYSVNKKCEIQLSAPVHFKVNEFGDETEYFKGSRFPLENAVIENVGYVDGVHKIVTISLCPVSLNLDNNILTFYSTVNANISWDLTNDFTNESLKPILSYVPTRHEMVYQLPNLINPDEIEQNRTPLLDKNRITNFQEQADYVIVCPKAFANELERLAAFRRLKGYTSKVFAIEDILNDPKYEEGDIISGINDDAGKLRAFLTDAYQTRGTRYVLLAGKYPAMPIRYGHTSVKLRESSNCHNGIPSDLYFAELNSSWNTTNKSFYGDEIDKIDYNAEISLGRIPFTSLDEINNFIDKLKIYELNPGLGDSNYLSKAFVTRQVEGLISTGFFKDKYFIALKNFYNGDNLREIFSNETYPFGKDVIDELNSNNYGFYTFVGHGSPYGVAVNKIDSDVYDILGLEGQFGGSKFETHNGLNNLTNKNYPSWSYSMSCETMPFDSSLDDNSEIYGYNARKNFGESYILGKEYGGVIFFGHTRKSFSDDGETQFKAFFNNLNSMYEDYLGEDGPEFSVTAGKAMVRLRLTTDISHAGRLTHNLLGDPLSPLWVSKPDITSYNKSESDDYTYIIDYNGPQHQCLFASQYIDENFHAGRGLGGHENEINVGINRIEICEFPNSLPAILPLYLQDITFNECGYIVAKDVFIGSSVNESKPSGNIVLSENVTFTIESLGDVSITGGISLKPYSTLIIKADGDVNINVIIVPANCTLIVEANTITTGSIIKQISSTVKLTERNPKTIPFKANVETKYKPTLVEGRTWWYTQSHMLYGSNGLKSENGISVGEEVEIDGESWHKIKIISTENSKWNFSSFDTSPRTIFYMREDGNKIYAAMFDASEELVNCESILCHLGFNSYCPDNPQLTYMYAKIGESFKVSNNDFDYGIATIDNISNITNSGFEYTVYKYTVDDRWEKNIIEGLGSVDDCFFFDPYCEYFYAPATNQYLFPQLRYITDPDGTIIYEGIGGYKLWEQTSLENVSVDSGVMRWYNMHGIEIAEPTVPGIYIRSNGIANEKYLVR